MITLAAGDWLATGWQQQPAHRVLLDGEPRANRCLLQTTWPLADLVTKLEAAGWLSSQATLSGEILSAVVPSRQELGSHAPWPMTRLGRSALATLTKTGATDQRIVLRIWETRTFWCGILEAMPLLLVSLTAQVGTESLSDMRNWRRRRFGRDLMATEKAGLAAALSQAATQPGRIIDLPLAAAQ